MELIGRILISPPFGRWISCDGCTSVLGSFTLEARRGLVRRTVQSLRPTKHGWVNRIGLRNPGIRAINHWKRDHVYSVVGLDEGDWQAILALLPSGLAVEVNLGCPNVHRYGITPEVLRDYCTRLHVIAKLPPDDRVDEMAEMCVASGVCHLHLCNTVATERGGESGARLFDLNLPIVQRIAARYPNVSIIAGGGVYGVAQAQAYFAAGAQHISLSTVWFTPWRVPAILRYVSDQGYSHAS